jgi:hypothetical protein
MRNISTIVDYFSQIGNNCPLLSRIRFNSTLYKRDPDGGFQTQP